MPDKNNTIIIGGGWAGLAAAIELSRQQQPVHLLESAKQLGGRARRVPFDKDSLDNGQHLLVGAYKETLALLDTIGLDIERVLQRYNLDWQVFSPHNQPIRVQASHVPAPFHLLIGLIAAQGLSWKDKYYASLLGHKLWKRKSLDSQDLSVSIWLEQHHQTETLIRTFWEPLCLATLNTPIREASAKCFVRVLTDAFLHSAAASNYLIPRQDLSGTFVDPAMTYIEKHAGHISLAHRVEKILLDNQHQRVVAVQCQDRVIEAEQVIITTPPVQTASLIKDIPRLQALKKQLLAFTYYPICTVYLRYPEHTHLPSTTPVIGMSNTISQWVFDRRVCQQAGVIAVVISSSGPHMKMDNEQLIATVAAELATCFPDWPTHINAKVIREKRATFACHVGIDSIRPRTETVIHGLFLAGDHVDTGYPATLEGAIQSGLRAATAVLNSK